MRFPRGIALRILFGAADEAFAVGRGCIPSAALVIFASAREHGRNYCLEASEYEYAGRNEYLSELKIGIWLN